jgi:WD40 repeat protein
MELLDLLIAERLVMLYSPSGAGKSSLIQAALIPDLEQERFRVLPVIRVGQEPPLPTTNRYLLSTLLSLEESVPKAQQTPLTALARLDLAAYLRQRQAGLEQPDHTVFIFDQFEEILTVDPTDQPAKDEFFRQVGAVLRDRNRWALFALREDYIAGLDPFLRRLPTRLKATFRLALLERDAARAAIQRPAERAGIPFAAEAADALVDDLRAVWVQQADGATDAQLGLHVEPVQLQVVCHRLWAGLPADATRIEPAAVRAVGNVDQALVGYYAEQVRTIAATTRVSERAIRDWCDQQLITTQGIRGQVLRGAGQSQGLDNPAIAGLVDAHLVRAEKRRGATWYELAHDRLIKPVQDNNHEWRHTHLSPLQRAAALWNQQNRPDGLLLRDKALKEAELWAATDPGALTAIEQDFLARCRKAGTQSRLKRWLSFGVTLFGILATVTAIYAVSLSIEAKQQTAIAKSVSVKSLLGISHMKGLVTAIEAVGLSQSGFQARFQPVPAQVSSGLLSAIQVVRERNALSGHVGAVRSVAISADGQTVVSGSADGTVRLWSPDGQLLGKGEHQGEVTSVAISADGQTVVSGGADGTVRRWSRDAQRLGKSEHQGGVTSVAVSADGQTVVSGGADGTVRRWSRDGRPLGEPWRGHRGTVTSVAVSADGQTAVSGGDDGTVRLWSPDGQPLGQPGLGHKGRVFSVAVSADGQTAVSGGDDNMVRLWSRDGRPLGEPWRGHGGWVHSVAISADGQTVVSGSADSTVRWWSRTGQPLGEPGPGDGGMVFSVAISADGQTVVSGGVDGMVRLWSRAAVHPPGESLGKRQDGVTSVAVSADGQTAVSGGRDGTVRRWSRTGQPPGELLGEHQGEVTSVAVSADGQTVVSRGRDRTVRRWSRAGQPPNGPLGGPAGEVFSVAVSADGQTVVSGGLDGTVRRWSRDGRPLGEPGRGHEGAAMSVAISADGQTVVSGGRDGTVRRWSQDGRSLGEPWRGHWGEVRSVAVSADGQTVVSGGADGAVRRWSRDGRPLGEPGRGHWGEVRSVAVSADGQTVVSGGTDGTVRLWSRTGQPLGQPGRGHEGKVLSVAISADGQTVVSGGEDGTVRWWSIGDWKTWLREACTTLHGHSIWKTPKAEEARQTCEAHFNKLK